MGYENIVIDTVEYMNDQVDLMNQLVQYINDNPTAIKEEVQEEAQEIAPEKVEEKEPEIVEQKTPERPLIEIKQIENQIIKNEK